MYSNIALITLFIELADSVVWLNVYATTDTSQTNILNWLSRILHYV